MEGPVRVGELAAVAQPVAGVAALLAALTAADDLRRPGGPGGAVADRADARRAQVPHAAAAGAGALERGPGRLPVTYVAAVPVPELDRGAALCAGRVTAHSGGSDRPRAALGSSLASAGFAAPWATGVVSTSIRSLGVHSSAVHSAASVSSFTCAGWRVSSADTEADDRCSPARSASRRRNCAPVHTSRWAAAIRSRQLIFTAGSSQLGERARDRPAIGIFDERRRGGDVAHRGAHMPVTK